MRKVFHYTNCEHYNNESCALGGACKDCITNADYCDINELRDEVRFHPDTYRRLFATGKIPAIKVAGKWYARKDAVIEYCEARS